MNVEICMFCRKIWMNIYWTTGLVSPIDKPRGVYLYEVCELDFVHKGSIYLHLPGAVFKSVWCPNKVITPKHLNACKA